MPPPYTPLMEVHGDFYYPEPYSLDPMPANLRLGLIPIGVLAILSVSATLILISFICYRLVTWRTHYHTFLGYNQYVLLVLNLLIADFQQSSAFLVSFHWIRFNRILAPSSPCLAQAWLLHSGDLSSGFFVLTIAVHTFITAVYGKRINHKTFALIVAAVWLISYFLTAIGLGIHGKTYFVRAGAWCWVSEAYEDDRLALHYFWIFLVQLGTILIYIATFVMLRQKTKRICAEIQQCGSSTGPNMVVIDAVKRITKLMTLYPCVYILLTLPLSAGRMWSMAHHGSPYSNSYACFAGSMLTSCGLVDSLLYTLTRRRLLRDTMLPASRSGLVGSDFTCRGITQTRIVTIDETHVTDSLDGKCPTDVNSRHDSAYEHSRNGSFDPVFGSKSTGISIGLQDMGSNEEQNVQEERPPLGQIAESAIEVSCY